MAEKDKLPPDSHPDSNPEGQPPLATPVPETDDDSSLDFGNVAQVRDGASGVIPLASLPDPTSSPSLVSWTEVIRQHRETAQNAPESADIPVTIDSVSDKDLLRVIEEEEQSRQQSPAVLGEQDTDKLGQVPLVQRDPESKTGSSIQLEGPRTADAPQTPSNSSIQFNMKSVPSDAGGAIPNPWAEAEAGHGGELDLADAPVAEAADEQPYQALSADDDDITKGPADPINPTGASSILDVLLENPRFETASPGQPPSDVINFSGEGDGEPVPLDEMDLDTPAPDYPPSDYPEIETPGRSVEAGDAWHSTANLQIKRKTDPALHIPAGDPEESVDLYAEGPVSHGISDSGTLKLDEEELKHIEERKRMVESSAIDLSSSPTGFDLDLASAKSGKDRVGAVMGESEDIDMSLPEGDDAESSQIRRVEDFAQEAATLSARMAQRKKAAKPHAPPEGLEPTDAEIDAEEYPEPAERRTRQLADEEAAYPEPEVAEEANVEIDEEIPTAPRTPSARKKSETAPRKKGGMLVGLLLGLLVGAGSLFGLWFGQVLPADPNTLFGGGDGTKTPDGTTTSDNSKANPQPAAQPADPEQARRFLLAGDFGKAVEAYDNCDQKNPAVLTGKGQAIWLGYLKAQAAAGKQPKAGDPEAMPALAAFKGAVNIGKEDKSAAAQMEVARAYLWQGLMQEAAGEFDKAAKIYDDGAAAVAEAQRGILNSASNRLKSLGRVQGAPPVGMIDPRQIFFAFMLMAQDEPKKDEPKKDEPKSDEPKKDEPKKSAPKKEVEKSDIPKSEIPKASELAGQESGFLFWEAMLLASQHKFGDAASKIAAIKAVHARQQIKLAGKGLNPLSDPREEMLPACLDELQRYWLLCEKLYQRPESEDLVRQKKTPDALEAAFDKSKGAENALAGIVGALKLANAKPEEIAAAIKKLVEADKTLASIATALKDAGIEDKFEEGIKKLVADKKVADDKVKAADDKLKGLATTLDKAGIKDPDVEKGIAAAIAARDDSDAIVKGVRERFVKEKLIADNAAKELLFKAVEEAITRGKSDAVTTLSKQKADAEMAAAKFAAELKESKTLADATAAKAKKDLAEQKAAFDETLSKVRTPVQVVDVWLPALSDRNRNTDTESAAAVADLVLKSNAPDEAKAKALAVKALVLRNLGKLTEARAAFAEAQKHAGFNKEKPWAKEVAKAAEVLNNPTEFVGVVESQAAPPAPKKQIERVDEGLKLFPAATFAKDHARLLAQRSLLKLEANDLASALEDAEAAVKGDPVPETQLVLARVLEKQNKLVEAERTYRDLLDLKLNDKLAMQARLGLARVLLLKGSKRGPAPKQPVESTMNGMTRDAFAGQLLLAMLLFAAPEPLPAEIEEALQLADSLIAQKEYLGYIIKADALAKIGRWNDALQAYSSGVKALHAVPKEYEGVLDRILAGHPSLQKPDAAIVQDQSLALKYYGEGLEFFRADRFDKAEQQFIQATRLNSQDARYWYFLGLTRWQQGKKQAAEADFKAGGELESQGKPTSRSVNGSFERVQGNLRRVMDKYRP